MKLYRAEGDMTEPKEVEGPGSAGNIVFDNRDSDGVVMWANTHFESLDDAWKSILGERLAHVKLSGRSVGQARRELERCQAEAGRAAELFSIANDAFGRYKK